MKVSEYTALINYEMIINATIRLTTKKMIFCNNFPIFGIELQENRFFYPNFKT